MKFVKVKNNTQNLNRTGGNGNKRKSNQENNTPESLVPLFAVNTFVLGNFKSLKRISEIISVSLVFFTAIALIAKVVIFFVKKL